MVWVLSLKCAGFGVRMFFQVGHWGGYLLIIIIRRLTFWEEPFSHFFLNWGGGGGVGFEY